MWDESPYPPAKRRYLAKKGEYLDIVNFAAAWGKDTNVSVRLYRRYAFPLFAVSHLKNLGVSSIKGEILDAQPESPGFSVIVKSVIIDCREPGMRQQIADFIFHLEGDNRPRMEFTKDSIVLSWDDLPKPKVTAA